GRRTQHFIIPWPGRHSGPQVVRERIAAQVRHSATLPADVSMTPSILFSHEVAIFPRSHKVANRPLLVEFLSTRADHVIDHRPWTLRDCQGLEVFLTCRGDPVQPDSLEFSDISGHIKGPLRNIFQTNPGISAQT